jgi:hypothetical protein
MLTAILNSTHLERVKFSPPDKHLHLDSIHSYPNGLSLSGISAALGNLATAHGRKLGMFRAFEFGIEFLSSSPTSSVLAVSKANILKDPKG